MKNLLYLFVCCCLVACTPDKEIRIQSGNLVVQVNEQLQTHIASQATGARPLMNGFQETEYLLAKNDTIRGFARTSVSDASFTDSLGTGKEYRFEGKNPADIHKILTIRTYDRFPDFAFYQVYYLNKSTQPLDIQRWVSHAYTVAGTQDKPLFWSFQGSSSGAREDWIQPIDSAFSKKNYMGMNDSDYGGGIPVTDLWRRDVGIAIGHTELQPRLVSLPVTKEAASQQAHLQLQYDNPVTFAPGDTLTTVQSFVAVHPGDCFATLQTYTTYMRAKGLHWIEPEPSAFESMWCSWGYERNGTIAEITGTLPKVKELGIQWATIDDGYQQAEGDWEINTRRFPGGDADMKRLVNQIHAAGLKAQLWWAPLAADSTSRLLQQHPDMILQNANGKPQFITWWDSWYMSPSHPATIAHTQAMLKRFLGEWNYDGLKMDGQHLNAIPPDFNPQQAYDSPLQAAEHFPDFYQMLARTAQQIKPHVVLQNCPCGTCMSFYNMPYTNQTVASDPTSSWQIRTKGKVYKAIMPGHAYFGDHVELSDQGSDFASQFGVGAVLGTKFTYPKDNPTVKTSYLLTPEKEIVWKKWFGLYNQKMLSKATYLGHLYDVGYDRPETHVIQKSDTLFYAFYMPSWKGKISLRGLVKGKTYQVRDYVQNRILGSVTATNPELDTRFEKNLLIEVYPTSQYP